MSFSTQSFQTLIGTKTGLYGAGEIHLPLSERLKHLYAIGKSGTGKSTLLFNLAVQDILSGHGLAVIDPHGDLVEELLHHIPRGRTRDVVYLNLADFTHPLAWNPLELQSALPVATQAGHILSACKHIWFESWGPRMEYLLVNALHALIEAGETLLSLPKVLTDEDFRAEICARIRDPKVRHYFEVEFAALDPRQRAEVISPVQNKIGQLLTHEAIRNVISRRKSSIDLPFMMDNRRILLVNLGKGLIGEEGANLFGSLLVSAIGAAAMARASQVQDERVPFFLYVDEFHNFSTASFAAMLSEVRKYKLGLVLAHQFTGQLSEKVRQAVFGNVATRIILGVGSEDAERLKLDIAPFPPVYAEELTPFTGLFKASGCEATPIHLFAPIDTKAHRQWRTGRAEMIRAQSRHRFANPREKIIRIVERELWPKSKFHPQKGNNRPIFI